MEGMTLEKLQVIIEAYTKPYRDELEKVKKQTSTATDHVERQTSRMRNSFRKVGSAVAALLGVGAIIKFAKSCIDLGSDLQEVQNVVDVTFGSMSKRVDAFSKNAISQFGLSELTAKRYMGTYGAMAKSFGIVEEAGYQMSASITGLTGDVASFYNLSTDEAYNKLKSIFTGETESLKELGVVMTQTALDQYALNNGFGKTTAKMTEQEKVMLRYQFVMSSLSDASGDFARTSGSWANQVRILTLQFESLKATIGQGLINAFTPVIRMINVVLAKLQTLAAYFKAFTGALFGNAGENEGSSGIASSMASAAGSSGDVADNMGSAAKSAADMKKSLAAFDEINNLSGDSGSSGGSGGGGAGAADFGELNGTLFGDVAVNPEIEAATNRIREAVEALKNAAAPTTEALKRLWNEGLARLGTFVWTGLNDFYHHFLVPIGKWTLGTGIPMFLDAINEFLLKINWEEINEALRRFWQALEPFAEKIGEGLLKFFRDLLLVGADFINVIVPGGLNAIAGALERIDPGKAEKIGYALGMIATAVAGFKIFGTVFAPVKKLLTFLSGTAIIKGLAKLVEYLPLVAGGAGTLGEAFAIAFPKVSTAITGIVNAIKLLPSFVGTASFDVIANAIFDGISRAIESVLPSWAFDFLSNLGAGIVLGAAGGSWFPGAGTIAGAIIGGILGALNGIKIDGVSILKKICDKIFNFDAASAFFEKAKENFSDAFNADTFAECGINIVNGIVNGFWTATVTINEPFVDLFVWFWNGICDVFGIASPAKKMEPVGEFILLGIVEGFRNTFGEWTKSLDEWYNQHIAPWFTAKKWSDLYNTMKMQMKAKWDETVGQWKTDIANWWNNNVMEWFSAEKWSSGLSGVKTGIKTAFEGAFEAVKELWNQFANWLNGKLTIDIEPISIMGKQVFEGARLDLGKIPTFASGGYPSEGQMFVAREAGPELVGRIGNRTAVANNDQIVDAVSKGVYMAVSNAGGMNEDTLYRALKRALQEVDLTAVMDSDRTFKALQKKALEYKNRTGKPAFGY